MERSREGDGSPLLKTNKKQAACQERFRPVSLKLFIHHAETRRCLLLQRWCAGAAAITSGWQCREGAAGRDGRVMKDGGDGAQVSLPLHRRDKKSPSVSRMEPG